MTMFSNTIRRYQDYLNAREAATGIPASTADREAVLSAAYTEEANRAAQNRQMELAAETLDLQKEAAKAESEAAATSGAIQTGASAAQLYMMYKGLQKDGVSLFGGTGAAGGLFRAGGTAPASAIASSASTGGAFAGEFGTTAGVGASAGQAAASSGLSSLGGYAMPMLGAGAGLYMMTGKDKQTGGTMAGMAAGSLFGPLGMVLGGVAGNLFGKSLKGSVICAELYSQGYLPYDILVLDGRHRHAFIDDRTYEGYLWWAESVVKLMRRSPLFTRLIAPIGRAWAYEMASKMDKSTRGSALGSLLMKTGVPICHMIGRWRHGHIRVHRQNKYAE